MNSSFNYIFVIVVLNMAKVFASMGILLTRFYSLADQFFSVSINFLVKIRRNLGERLCRNICHETIGVVVVVIFNFYSMHLLSMSHAISNM